MNNFLLTKNGVLHTTAGIQHNIYVQRTLKVSLKQFLKSGGVRVKTHRDHIAIEAGLPLTDAQMWHINRALKQDDYYSMVVSIGGKYGKKEKFRPIRRI